MDPLMYTKRCLLLFTSRKGKYFIQIFLIWIVFGLHIILHISKNIQDVKSKITITYLERTYKELNLLHNRKVQLYQLVLRYFKSFNDTRKTNNVLNPKYELLKRRIENNIQEFWYFTKAQLTKLNVSNKTRKFFSINDVLSGALDIKQELIRDIQKLNKVDGYSSSKKRRSINLSNIVQKRLYFLQNPTDCKSKKKLVCSLNNDCGFGCQIHHLVSCMILAYGTQRTLILQSSEWYYNENGWEEIFMPLSSSCTDFSSLSSDLWPGKKDSETIEVPIGITIFPRPIYLPLAVPKDLFPNVAAFHKHPIVWWVGQILKYIWKLQNSSITYVQEKMTKLGVIQPYVGVHVRRTDKINLEASYHYLEEYMSAVNEYYNQIEGINKVRKKRIYIATDDFDVITEAKTKYPQYQIIYDYNLEPSKIDYLHENDKVLDVITDVQILAKSEFLVCTMSSNLCRLAYELMQTNYVDATNKIISLDDVYYYSQQFHNKRKAVLSHKAQSPNEIDLIPGDLIHIAGNHWDGYSLGTNLRTKKKGLYPSFKVDVETEVVKFPNYSNLF